MGVYSFQQFIALIGGVLVPRWRNSYTTVLTVYSSAHPKKVCRRISTQCGFFNAIMASPQKENGNTGISNELLEQFLLFDFPSASPIKIWLFISRKTYGYQKKTDYLSLTQIERATHLSRPTVVQSLQWLVKACLLVKGAKSQKGTVYGLNKDYEQWVVNTALLVKHRGVQVVKPALHTIKRTIKSNTPIGAQPMKPYNESIIELDVNGDEITPLQEKQTTFGKYPARIATHYCQLTDKRSAARQLPAAKELLLLAQEDYPEDTAEDWYTEIINRIDIAHWHYQHNNVKEWGLGKVAENWNIILKEWNVAKRKANQLTE